MQFENSTTWHWQYLFIGTTSPCRHTKIAVEMTVCRWLGLLNLGNVIIYKHYIAAAATTTVVVFLFVW